MTIKYKSRYIKINLIFGIFWLIFFILGIFTKNELHWFDYGYLLMSVLYLGLYFYQKEYQYLIIENGVIKHNTLYGRKLDLSEIKAIRKFAGDFILKSEQKDFKIDTQIIDPDSLIQLKAELNRLEVDWI